MIATTDGVVLLPSEFAITTGSPPSITATHEAMMQVETGEVPENTVVQVFQDGYLYHEKVLRHAKVGVSKKPAGAMAGSSVPATSSDTDEDGEG